MKISINIILVLFLAYSNGYANNNSNPHFSIKSTNIPPLVDGDLNDEVWKSAGGTNEFIRFRKGKSFSPELLINKTSIKSAIDNKFLYLGVEMKHEFLFTAKNKLFKFKNEINKKDGPVWKDDTFEIFIKPEMSISKIYHFIINAKGTLYDASIINGKRNKIWDSNAIVKTKIHEGRWTIEAAIPLKLFNYKQTVKSSNESINICFSRKISYNNSLSSWPCCKNGFGDTFGQIKISPIALYINNDTPLLIDEGKNTFTLNLISNLKNEYLIKLILKNNNTKKIVKQKIKLSGNLNKINTNFILKNPLPQKALYSIFTAKNHKELYCSPEFNIKKKEKPKDITIVIENPKCKIKYDESELDFIDLIAKIKILPNRKKHKLNINMPTLKTKVQILTNKNKESIISPYDEIKKKNKHYEITKYLLSNNSMLWPSNTEKEIYVSPNGISAFWFFPQGLTEFPIKNYSLYFDIPEGYHLLGPNVFKNKYTITLEKTRKLIRNQNYIRYILKFKNPVNYKSDASYWSTYSNSIQLALKCLPTSLKGSNHTIYWGTYGSNVIELARKIKIRKLPLLRGKKWNNLRFFMWEGVVYDGSNFELAEEMTKTFSNSGVTECLMHSRKSSPLYNSVLTLPSQYGIKALRVIPDMWFSFNEKEVLRKNPKFIRITKENKKARGLNFKNICPVAFKDDKALKKELTKGLREYLKVRKGVLKGLVIDVEFREKHFTCYCPKCVSEFQKEYGISRNLTPDIINSKFKKQWVEFSCKMISEKISVVNSIIKSVDENIKLYIYSAYQRKTIKDCHGTDWKLWAPNIDIASCGYGRQRQNAINTIKCLQPYNVPLLGGVIVDNYKRSSRAPSMQINLYQLMSRLIDCKGGILAYSNSSGFDGRSYYNIAEFSRLVSDYENVFVNRKTNAKFIACDLPKNDTIVLEDNNRKLVILMNGNNNIKNFSITFQENQNGIDYYSKEKFEDIKTISGTISPMSIKVFVINNALN